jgi:cytochrome P450
MTPPAPPPPSPPSPPSPPPPAVSTLQSDGTALHYNPYDYEIHEDPYPTYARLRAEAPLYRNDELDFWALSRHEDVLAGFRNPAQLSNRFGVSLDPAAYGPEAHRAMSFLAMDPPRHTRMRSLVSKAFTPRRVAELEAGVRTVALEHIEAALERGSFDFVADFAGRMPMDVISEMIGVPRADRAELRRLADLLVDRVEGINDIPPEGIEAAFTMAGYFGDMVSARRAARGDDLTSALLDADMGGDRLTDDEVIGFLFLMTVAGNETTTKLLANAWYWGWRFPDERAKVLADPTRVNDWVEETLRFDTSTQMLLRVTTGEVELHGITLPDSARVLLLLGSANRDESVWDDAERYDLDRDTTKLVSFGSGRHFCLGAALARLEARVGLHELVTRVAGYDIDEAGAARVHSINVRGFAALPTTVTVR